MKPTLYKSTLDLGKFDAEMRGEKHNRVTVQIELRGTAPARAWDGEALRIGKLPEDLELSIMGNIWNKRGNDIISGGQNYDDLLEIGGDVPLIGEIVGVWKRWHLNGMRPGCEHQRDWNTSKEIVIYEYSRSSEGTNARNAAKERAINAALADEVAGLSAKEKDALQAEYFIKSDRAEVPEGYKHYKTETKTAGWVRPEEHPDGLLGKACETCGYKYGTAWKHEALPREIVNQVMGWAARLEKVSAK